MKSFTHNGKPFRSMYAFADHYGINKHTLHGRLKRGETLDEAIQPRGPTTSQPVEHNGETFESTAALAERLGINLSTLFNRLKKGESIEYIVKNHKPQVLIEWTEEKTIEIALEVYEKFNDGQPCGFASKGINQYLKDNSSTALQQKINKYWGSKLIFDKEVLGLKNVDRGEALRPALDKVISDFKKTWGDPDSKFSKFLKHIGYEGYPCGYSEVNYKNQNTEIKISCNIHNQSFYQLPESHKGGCCGCDECSSLYQSWNTQQYTIEDIFKLAKEKHGDNLEYNFKKTKELYKGYSYSYFYYTCPIHPELGERRVSCQNHLPNGQGCPSCGSIQSGISNTESLEENIRKSEGKHGKGRYVYSYIKDEDFKTKRDKVSIFCPKLDKDGKPHGPFLQTWNNHIRGSGCTKEGCNTLNNSKAVQLISKILSDHNINFEREKRFDECRHKNSLPFDFFLSELNILIEKE